MTVNLIKKSSWRIPRQFLRHWLEASVAGIAQKSRKKEHKRLLALETVVVFVDALEMQALNKQFRGKDKVTDILSFAGDGRETLGELVLCGEVLVAQAKTHGLSPRQELGYLLIHGLLHLLGYEHENGGAQAKAMFALQDRVFETLCSEFFEDC